MKQNDRSKQQSLKELSDFINSNPDPRELKRSMSVMMWIEGVPCCDIQKILNVSATFVSQVKMKFIQHGVKELKLRYQGSKAYLSREERSEIINYLEAQEYLSLQQLREYI
ncbi:MULTISPECIES: hypothetical protein [unclassified Microcoleus]|uniref:hypothetical protein n=1 Tax=unclassified Microcoleus TaxID=2642155 RepID=UPI002FD086EA